MPSRKAKPAAEPVFGTYDQKALDAQYNLRALVPTHQVLLDRWLADSAAADRAADVTLNDTTFDLTFSADLPDADATGPGRAAGHTIYLETYALWNFDGAAEPAPFVVDVSDVTWTTTIDGVTTTIDAGPDGGFTEEEIETPLTRQTRYLDKLVDELAKGKKMEKILRE